MKASIRALAVTLAASGCVPMITHPPRVEPGGRWTFGAGWIGGDVVWEDEYPALLPAASARYVHGWVDSSGGTLVGVEYGVEKLFFLEQVTGPGGASEVLGLLLPSSIEAYRQLSTGGDGGDRGDAGVGVALSPMYLMPYGQYGRVKPDGTGWYTTQGLAAFFSPAEVTWLDGRPEYVRLVMWMPSLALRTAGREGGALQLHLTGGLGLERERDWPDGGIRVAGATWLVGLGGSIELGGRGR